ncbi:hypothetical protein CPG37_02795 [Malaciobacter canalis]|uniref:Uncharacterized protein n=1 Tax=Malaciobacter canalis TaxID=1912871 RepID=A0ABX4LSC1_9BACT|nr:hypothetical protein [Malaciobacter canalis]PHO10789.1 hypothetical protein CPG37_02795 [Malaciobacter canalis]QEE33946.1 hypothetical protein ACAN_2508 [Malaciobacter canalis]
MIVTKEWDDVVEKIYKLIDLDYIMDLELTIPSSLFSQYKAEYQEQENERLSYRYINLKATSYCTGQKISKITRIKFGSFEKVDYEKKELTIEFKYANQIVLYLIHLLQPDELKINTLDLDVRSV